MREFKDFDIISVIVGLNSTAIGPVGLVKSIGTRMLMDERLILIWLSGVPLALSM